jgi:pyruvate dehydrogenase E2 component (dihydrolipoamide acetyltransferase)
MFEFKMPRLGADMEAGTLVAWHKQPGDQIRRGDLMAEVETDKGVIDVESFSEGILDRILVNPGEKVPVGTVLAWIRADAERPSMVAPPSPPPPPVPAGAPTPGHPAVAETTRLAMSPSARRLARELGVDPARVAGTGPGGAITREDIERAAKSQVRPAIATPPAVATPAPSVPTAISDDRFFRMRQTIAAAMSRSKREIPHYYLSTSLDFQPAINWLAETNLQRPITDRLLYGVLLLKAVALALREVPELNSVWEGGEAVQKSGVHLGVAISLRQGGLVAPAIHDADQMNLTELMHAFRDLVNRSRSGKLRSSELSDPTITVTSLGEQGVETVFGVIYPPQTAIVGFGKVVERPWSLNGVVTSRQVMTATLSADHRVSDGHRGGIFLNAVARLLQTPEKL